jgi:hypothetical protein
MGFFIFNSCNLLYNFFFWFWCSISRSKQLWGYIFQFCIKIFVSFFYSSHMSWYSFVFVARKRLKLLLFYINWPYHMPGLCFFYQRLLSLGYRFCFRFVQLAYINYFSLLSLCYNQMKKKVCIFEFV